MNKKRSVIKYLLWAFTAILCIVLPFISDNYILNVETNILMTALLAQSFNILSGYSGQFSFGQAAFFGIGAYSSVIFYTKFEISPWIGMLFGMIIAAAVGVFIGYISIRCKIKGDFFALATLAFAEIIRLAVYNSDSSLFGGPSGIFVKFIKGGSPENFQFASFIPYYFAILIPLVIVMFGIHALTRSRHGIMLTAVRENENAADALGVNVVNYKLGAIAVSAAIAALAGTFYAQYYLFVDPDGVFGSSISVQAIIPCIIGGVGTLWGPVIGSLIIVPLQEITSSLFTDISGVNMILYGILIVSFILFCPNGFIGLFKMIRKKIKQKESIEEDKHDNTDCK